ncbi:hypothetical protein [Limosilactobacillus vaginalis]|nr:hypothetical protein [Limosilactobacillus vaginalis]MDM8222137.1 hypothetical protein [Limosilactobacillus vaginalis]
MTEKKFFSDKRWTRWPSEGIKTGGKPKTEVHKAIQKWLKENSKKHSDK